MGADKEVAERLLADAGYSPIGELMRDPGDRESVQQYGYVEKYTSQPVFHIIYNSKDEIKRKRFIQQADLANN